MGSGAPIDYARGIGVAFRRLGGQGRAMGGLPDLVDTMTGCLLGGPMIGQLLALGVLALIVLVALFVAGRLLRSRLTAPVLVVGLILGTGFAVYAVGSIFAVFEKDEGVLHPGESRRSRCEPASDGTEAARAPLMRLALSHDPAHPASRDVSQGVK